MECKLQMNLVASNSDWGGKLPVTDCCSSRFRVLFCDDSGFASGVTTLFLFFCNSVSDVVS